MNSYLLKNVHLYHQGVFKKTDILVKNGYIEKIDENITGFEPVIDLQGKYASHNFIDIHTHLREPGFEHKETIRTGSLSALYGGYGTIVAMANTLPCMDDLEAIEDFKQRVTHDAYVNVYTYSAITENLKGQKLVDMAQLVQEDIVLGFSDDGKGVQNDEMMDLAMQLAGNLDSIIVAHCEDESELHGGCIHEGHYAQEHHLIGINSASEYKQVARDLNIVRQYHNRYHICHISTKETVDLLRQARQEGLCVSGEASPHHLILTEDNIQDCSPQYKMNPPLRSKEDHQALIKGLNDKTITVIATDHAPHAREEKATSIEKAPFGIIGLQHAFSLLYTYLVKKNIVSLETILDALTVGPAQVLHLDCQIQEGSLANLCIFDLNEHFIIEEKDLKSKSANTPFLGAECYGRIVANIVNGEYNDLEEK